MFSMTVWGSTISPNEWSGTFSSNQDVALPKQSKPNPPNLMQSLLASALSRLSLSLIAPTFDSNRFTMSSAQSGGGLVPELVDVVAPAVVNAAERSQTFSK